MELLLAQHTCEHTIVTKGTNLIDLQSVCFSWPVYIFGLTELAILLQPTVLLHVQSMMRMTKRYSNITVCCKISAAWGKQRGT